jgi:hypothetical protein
VKSAATHCVISWTEGVSERSKRASFIQLITQLKKRRDVIMFHLPPYMLARIPNPSAHTSKWYSQIPYFRPKQEATDPFDKKEGDWSHGTRDVILQTRIPGKKIPRIFGVSTTGGSFSHSSRMNS